MNTQEYKEYISLIFDNYLRKLLYVGTIIVAIFLLIRFFNHGDKVLESVMLLLGVVIFGELFIQTFKWLFVKAPRFFKVPDYKEDSEKGKEN